MQNQGLFSEICEEKSIPLYINTNFWAKSSKKDVFNSNTVMHPLPLDWPQYRFCTLSSTAKVIFLTDRNTAPDVGLAGHLCTDSCTKNDEKGYFFQAGVCASLSPFSPYLH